MGTSPPGYEHVDANKEKSRFLNGWTYDPLLLNNETIFLFYILDLMFFFFFFHRVAASTLARPTTGGTGLTTVFNALFLVARSHDGATTNWT
jgi:hypothetical protein